MDLALLVLPDCLLVALGWIVHNRFAYSREFFAGLEKLVYFFLFPALMIRSLTLSPFSIATTSNFLILCFALAVIGSLLAYLAKPILKPSAIALASSSQCAYRFNTYIGLSLAPSVAGPEGLAVMAILVGFSVPIVNIFAVKTLAKQQGSNLLLEIIKNPLVVSTFIGLGLNFMGIQLPGFIDTTFAKLSQSAIPLGLICVGAALMIRTGSQDGKLVAWIVSVRLLIMPIFGLALAYVLGMSAIQTQMIVLFTALPSASAAYILAVRMGGDGKIVASTISIGTICCVFTIPLWIYLTQIFFNLPPL